MLRDEKIDVEHEDRIEVREAVVRGHTAMVFHDHRGLREAVLILMPPDQAEAAFALLGSHLRKPGFPPSGPARDGWGRPTGDIASIAAKITAARPPLALVGKPASEQDARLAIALVGGDDPEAA